jgi:pimeloyl-ACP methyl ester carboxylesterase
MLPDALRRVPSTFIGLSQPDGVADRMHDGSLDLQGNRIHYRQQNGGGDSVVFIHGWASSSRMWLRELEAFGGHYRCLALDLPGHGLSTKPPLQWYSLARFVDVTCGFVRALGAQPACLVGHSLGGSIALEYALRCPEDVLALVLVNPVITGRLQSNLHWLHRPGVRRVIVNLTRRVWPRLAARLRLALSVNRLPLVPDGHVRRNLDDLTQATADSLLGSARATRNDLSPRLDEVRAPTLVVVGRRDRTVPPEDGRLAARRIPGARLVELPTDHHPGDEAPEAFVQALREFLDQRYSAAP